MSRLRLWLRRPWTPALVVLAGLALGIALWIVAAVEAGRSSGASDPGIGLLFVTILLVAWSAIVVAVVGVLSLPPLRRRAPEVASVVALLVVVFPGGWLLASVLAR